MPLDISPAKVYDDPMIPEVQAAKEKAEEARYLLKIGGISLVEAKFRCKEYIDMVNEGAKRLSKEYGNTYRPVSVSSFLR